MRMLHISAVVVGGLLSFTACGGGDESGVGMVNPQSVTTQDLYGYWVADPMPDEPAGPRRIFAFVSPDDADYEMPLSENGLSAPGAAIGAVYQAGPYSPPAIQQLTSFEVKDGEILQTVLGDARALPDTQYATEIKSFTREKSMVIESDSSFTGSREFRYYERCPAEGPSGWSVFRGQACTSYVSTGTSLAVDADGGVHAASGVGAGDDAICPPTPTFTDIHPRACAERHSETPNMMASSMSVGADGILRHAFLVETLKSDPNYAEDRAKLYLRERAVAGTEWTERKVSDTVFAQSEIRLLEHDDERVIVIESQLEITIFRDTGSTFEEEDVALAEDDLDGSLVDAVAGPDGQLVLAVGRYPSIYRQKSGGFEAVQQPVELQQRSALDVHVDEQGRIHAVFPGRDVAGGPGNMVIGRSATYAILDGDEWTTYPLGLIERAYIVSQGDNLQVVVLTEKAARSALALLTIRDDGLVVSELIDDREPLGLGGSAETFVDPAAAIGPDGTIAATFDGSSIWLKHPDAPFEPRPYLARFEFKGEGKGRIYSEDGEVECSESCEIQTHVGARFFVKADAENGTDISFGWCPKVHQDLFGGCWADVRVANDPLNPEIQGANFGIHLEPSPFYGTLPMGDGRDRVATAVFVDGENLALSLAFNAGYGDFPIGDTSLDTGDIVQLGGVAVYDRANKTGVARKLPTSPSDVALRADGNAQFVFQAPLQMDVDGVDVGPGTVFGLMSPQGELTVRTLDSLALATAVDGEREIALVANYDSNLLALVVDDAVIPIEVAAPVGRAFISVDGDDIIIWADSYLVRVRGSQVTMSEMYAGVTPVTLSSYNGRVVSIVNVSDVAGLGSPGTYAVEYGENLQPKLAAAVPPPRASSSTDSNYHFAATRTGAMLVSFGDFYEFDEQLKTSVQITLELGFGPISDQQPSGDGMYVLTYNSLIELGSPE